MEPTRDEMARRKIQTIAHAQHQHAKGCKKPYGDCKACEVGVKWFAGLPLDVLTEVLEEPQAPRMPTSLPLPQVKA